MFVNDKTLFNFIAPDVSRDQIRDLPNLFKGYLACVLSEENIPEPEKTKIIAEYEKVGYSNTNSKSVLGSMNDLAFHYKYHIQAEGGVHSSSLPSIIKKLNRMPMGALGYKFPIEALKALYAIATKQKKTGKNMNMSDDDFEKLRRELVFEQVSKAMKENPGNWASKLEELGFQWVDDEYDEDENEENLAKPENANQELLVAYFEGSAKLPDQVFDAYWAERDSPTPNYPLIRKYFRTGNDNLKRLLMFGLERKPTDIGLLNDLGFFHEFRNILGELIHLYLKACKEEKDMKAFEELALNFYYDTEPGGFDALYELQQQNAPDTEKAKIVQRMIQERRSQPESIQI